jgi:EmrB/QacA subfamily drug resistance transporter
MRIERLEYKYLVGVAFLLALFMDLMDSAVVNVALPTLAREFHASTAALEWVVSAYLLSLATWIPAAGWLGDRFGTKRVFQTALAMFVVGSAACGMAPSVEALAVLRFVQGIGGGMMVPVGSAMLFRAFVGPDRPKGAAFLMVATAVAPLVGPLVGGALVDTLNWRWIFYVNVPIGLGALVFATVFVHEHRERQPGRFDPAGFLLSALGLAGVLLALSQGPREGWSSPVVVGAAVVAVVGIIALSLVETHLRAPMLDLELFRNAMFRQANLTVFTTVAVMVGLLFLLPFYLQGMRGLSAFQSGLLQVPGAIGQLLMLPAGVRVYKRLGPRRTLTFSSAGLAITSALFLLVGLQTNLLWVAAIMFLRGIAMSFTFISMQTAAFATVPPEKMGRASSLFSTQRQVASACGVAALATVVTVSLGSMPTFGIGDSAVVQSSLVAFHNACLAAVLIAVAGVAFASRVPGGEPSSGELAEAALRRAGVGSEPRSWTEHSLTDAAQAGVGQWTDVRRPQ